MAAKVKERESGETWWLFLYRSTTGDLNLEMPHIQERATANLSLAADNLTESRCGENGRI
jgi:hypothetical protein